MSERKLIKCDLFKTIGATVCAIATVATIASSAQAGDFYGKSATWTGFYLGAGVGAGAIVHTLDVQEIGGPGNATFDGIGGEGIFGTVQLGYDVQLGPKFVIGAFFDYDFSNMKTDASFSAFGASGSGDIAVDDSWTIGARAGFLSSPSTLWYAGAGYTRVNLGDAEGSISFGGPPVSGSFPLPDFSGYSLLAGVESQLGNNFSLKLEYRFTQLDRESVFNAGFIDIGLEPSMHTARLVASYRFDFSKSEPLPPMK